MTPEELAKENIIAQEKSSAKAHKRECRLAALRHANQFYEESSLPKDSDEIIAVAQKYYDWLIKD